MPGVFPEPGIARTIAEALGVRDARRVDVCGPWGSAKPLAAAQAAAALGLPVLYITGGRIESESVFDDLCTIVGDENCALFPAWEVLPTDSMTPADDIVAERMNTLERLTGAMARGSSMVVAAPIRSLMQRVVSRNNLEEDLLEIRVGKEYDLESLVASMTAMGYERELMVERRGEVCVRGGILDVFPISSELPFRVEFFGDEVESIRRFEPENQRSVDSVEAFRVLPRSEKALLTRRRQNLADLLDYFPGDTLVVLDEPSVVEEEANKLTEMFPETPHLMTWAEVEQSLVTRRLLVMSQMPRPVVEGAERHTSSMHATGTWTGNLDAFWRQLRTWDADGYTVVLVCNNAGERRRLLELLEDQGYRPGQDKFDLRLELGRLSAGFISPDDRLAVLSEREMFGRHYIRRSRRRFEAGAGITNFGDLRAGDYVVHAVHGIGRYEGMRRFDGRNEDFLVVRYSGGDALYLPASNVDMISKYSAGDGAVPKMDRLGGASWSKAKARVKKALRDMTEELVRLYAARENAEGHAFNKDTHWQAEFEDSFEYDETPDQLRAIADVKTDMELSKPMDRLLCGDVGFGKTEVALRAAFKAAMDGKQVAMLAPTTVLAQQHFSTFCERLADYPVSIGLLCRFVSAKDQKRVIDQVKAGEVDILIGTHRLLSKDIGFKNLGLLIVDEEQRFGVAHKEKLKHYRANIDVLTMTATPIPRTLNFSLMGARDMSTINTAPNDRLPIHTCIEVFDEHLVQEAILRELSRQGQVFYLHNRVQTIEAVAAMIQRLVPSARIAIGHGQMGEHALEKVMVAFINKEVDVLVCTTIIGSGIDIPNANTIIVDRADMFGLAELYQLRGRVGRYKHRAFAYLLVPGDRAITEDAQKRLKALEEFSVLGSGLRIAMRDLEIRGCGNILGGEQHGHIISVGYDTYLQLLGEAVAELKGQPVIRRVVPPFEVAVDAYIPEGYVPSEAQKLTLYKRIAGIATPSEADEMLDELKDRFGSLPGPVRRLIEVMRVRATAADYSVRGIRAGKDGSVAFEFESAGQFGRPVREMLARRFGNRIACEWTEHPVLKIKPPADAVMPPVEIARRFLDLLQEEL